MSDDEDLRKAFAKEMDEDADDESSDDGGTRNNRTCLLNFKAKTIFIYKY